VAALGGVQRPLPGGTIWPHRTRHQNGRTRHSPYQEPPLRRIRWRREALVPAAILPTTSIRSSRPSPRSSTGCASPRSAAATIYAAISAALSQPSSPTNAATTSKKPDTLPSKPETLYNAAACAELLNLDYGTIDPVVDNYGRATYMIRHLSVALP
jgi:hypothetical protein